VNNQAGVRLNLRPGAKIQHHGGGRCCLMGAIDFSNAGQIMADGQRLFVDHNAVVIDISSAEISNSAGLAVMMEWASWCDIREISLVYEGMQASVLAVAELNGVAMMLPERIASQS
jgi:anti-anti-sigma regulatory factor